MIKKLTKEDLKKLALDLYFEISDQDCDYILKYYEDKNIEISYLDKIDVDDVPPMFFPYVPAEVTLREDEIHNSENIIENASEKEDNYIKIALVIKK